MLKNKKKTKKESGIHLYKTKKGKKYLYHWEMLSRNGRVVMRSGEEYKSKQWAIKNLMLIAEHFAINQHYFDHSDGNADLIIYDI